MSQARYGESTHLEGDDCKSHHGCPNHGEGILPAEETRVEETNTRNHDPDESGGGKYPCDVTGVVDPICAVAGIDPLKGSRWVRRGGGRSEHGLRTRRVGTGRDSQAS